MLPQAATKDAVPSARSARWGSRGRFGFKIALSQKKNFLALPEGGEGGSAHSALTGEV